MSNLIITIISLFGGFYVATIKEIMFLCNNVSRIEVLSNPFDNYSIKYEPKKYVDLIGNESINYYLYINGEIYLSHKNSYKRYLRFLDYNTKPKRVLIVNNKAILI